MIPVQERLLDADLEAIHERWQRGLNGDGALTWYSRDVKALLGEVIYLRRVVASTKPPKPEPIPEPREDQEVIVTGLPTEPKKPLLRKIEAL